MKLYYSCDFENGLIKHHGNTEYPLNVYQNSEPYIESMTAFVKADLTKSIKKWGFTADDMIKADFTSTKEVKRLYFLVGRKKP